MVTMFQYLYLNQYNDTMNQQLIKIRILNVCFQRTILVLKLIKISNRSEKFKEMNIYGMFV